MVNTIGIYFSLSSCMAGGFPPFDDPGTQDSLILPDVPFALPLSASSWQKGKKNMKKVHPLLKSVALEQMSFLLFPYCENQPRGLT